MSRQPHFRPPAIGYLKDGGFAASLEKLHGAPEGPELLNPVGGRTDAAGRGLRPVERAMVVGRIDDDEPLRLDFGSCHTMTALTVSGLPLMSF